MQLGFDFFSYSDISILFAIIITIDIMMKGGILAVLNLDFEYLDEIFDMDFEKKLLSLKPKENGDLYTSMNVQQFYTWHRHKQTQYPWSINTVTNGGFIGKQPVVKFAEGLKLIVPAVEQFIVHGLITTENEAEYPFIVEDNTQLIMSRYSRPHAYAFLSHSSLDKLYVRELRKQMYSVCDTFFDETDIKPGESIISCLEEGLEKTDLLILIFSKNAKISKWVQKEWASMLHMDKPLVLIRIDDTPVPALLKDIKYIDGRNDFAEVVDSISWALDI